MGFLARLIRKRQKKLNMDWIKELDDRRPDLRILRVQGDMTATVGAGVEEIYRQARLSGDALKRDLIIDFADATACNFSTLSYIVESLRIRVQSGRKVALINVPRSLESNLEIAKVKELVPVYKTEEEAIAALAASH